jgi:hypothetical protein
MDFETGDPVAIDGRSCPGRPADQAEPAGPRQRRRPPGPGGEPLRRHEVPRRLRDARRHRSCWPPTEASSRSRSTAAPCT